MMKDPKDMLLSDAIEEAIEANRDKIIFRRLTIVLAILDAILTMIILGGM